MIFNYELFQNAVEDKSDLYIFPSPYLYTVFDSLHRALFINNAISFSQSRYDETEEVI